MRIYVTINGVETDLSESTPLEVLRIDNLGASKATRITERGPAQDGDSDIDRILEPRIIPMLLQAQSSILYPYEDNRDLINRLFKATNTPIKLHIVRDNGAVFVIDTQSVGDVDLPLTLREQAVIKCAVTLRAGTPIFYDPIVQSVNFGLMGGGGAMAVPTPVPTPIGGSTLDQTTTIAYDGTYRDTPTVLVYGPIADFKIEHLGTGHTLFLNGYTINSGDYYTFDMRYGRKIIYKNGVLSDSRIGELSSDSNIARFAIESDPDIVDGLNTFRVTGSSVTGVTQVYVQYNRRFDGI